MSPETTIYRHFLASSPRKDQPHRTRSVPKLRTYCVPLFKPFEKQTRAPNKKGRRTIEILYCTGRTPCPVCSSDSSTEASSIPAHRAVVCIDRRTSEKSKPTAALWARLDSQRKPQRPESPATTLLSRLLRFPPLSLPFLFHSYPPPKGKQAPHPVYQAVAGG